MFMDYCRSKQLRPKAMGSYEQTLKLFVRWLKENMEKQYPLGCYKGADITFDAEGKYVSGAIPATANNCVNVGEVKK